MLLGLENITDVFPRTLILIFPRIIYFMLIEKQKTFTHNIKYV